jgi:cytochrome c oxidase subunit 2
VLDPAGSSNRIVNRLFWAMLVVSLAVWLAVVVAAFWAALSRRRKTREDLEPVVAVPNEERRRHTRIVGGLIGGTVLVLLLFLVFDFTVGRALAEHPARALTVEIIGHQWWWEIHYVDPDPSKLVVDANEVHIPAGQPVQDRTGTYRAQCAEFCGAEHAKMALTVIVHSPTDFATWLAASRAPAAEPNDSSAKQGEQVFLAGACSSCHSIAGTAAFATVGPNLTHLASRQTIGAGTLVNARGNLAGWIIDPQTLKPGVRMPSNQLEAKDLRALLDYLETLK